MQTIQNPSVVNRISNFFTAGNGIKLTCSSPLSSSAQFPTLRSLTVVSDVMIINTSSTIPAFIAFGATTPTAVIPTGDASGGAQNGICIPPGAIMVLNKGDQGLYVAGITASSSAVLYLYQGYGS